MRHIRGVSGLTIFHRRWSELGVWTHVPRLPRTNRHQPPRQYKANNPLSARYSSVRYCAGISVQSSCNYACLLSPFAYLCTRPSPRSVSAVREALPGLFLVCYRSKFLTLCVTTNVCTRRYRRRLLLLQQAAAAAAAAFAPLAGRTAAVLIFSS